MTRIFAILVISAVMLQFACGAPPDIRSSSFFGGGGGGGRGPSFSLPSSSSLPSFSSFPSFSGAGAGSAPSLSSFTPPSFSSSFSAPSFSLPSRGSAPAFPPISASSASSSSNSRPDLPDPQQALQTLSDISKNPSFASGLQMMETTIPAIASQMAPSTSQLGAQPSTEDAAVDLPASSATSAAAAATAAAPIRGQSPFPYQPTHFIDPTNNPTNATPQAPADSCSQTDFTCQAYKQCYPCYTNTGLSQCMSCLGLMRCQDANCQLKQMCNLCKTASSMAVCAMAQPYCPL